MKAQELINQRQVSFKVAEKGYCWMKNGKKYYTRLYYNTPAGERRMLQFKERYNEDDFPYVLIRTMYNGALPWTDDVDMCPNCGGKGRLDHYRHIYNGVCYKCEGKRIINKEYPSVKPFNK